MNAAHCMKCQRAYCLAPCRGLILAQEPNVPAVASVCSEARDSGPGSLDCASRHHASMLVRQDPVSSCMSFVVRPLCACSAHLGLPKRVFIDIVDELLVLF